MAPQTLTATPVVIKAGRFPGATTFPGPTQYPGRGNTLSAKPA